MGAWVTGEKTQSSVRKKMGEPEGHRGSPE